MLLFKSRLSLFLGKLCFRWSGLFEVVKVMLYGAVEIWSKSTRPFRVNGKRLKHCHNDEGIDQYASWKLNEPHSSSPE